VDIYIERVGERRLTRLLIWGSLAGVALLAPLAGCGDDDGDEESGSSSGISGTFAGDTKGKEAFVAIVASADGEDGGESQVYLCDATQFCESLPASVNGESLEASSDNSDATAEGELDGDAISGTADLPDGKTATFEAEPATAASGVYDLTLSDDGKLRGASESGVALTGESTLPQPGSGTLKLADGTRLEFEATEDPAAESMGLRPGQARLIVLTNGELRGAARSPGDGDEVSYFFLRSS
jgi:hypothetical protein